MPSSDWQASNAHKTFKVRRWGFMVELDMHLLRSSVYGTRVPVATLPEQYRPSATKEVELASLDANSSVGSVVVVIEPNGAMDVSTSLPGARWLVGSACFLV